MCWSREIIAKSDPNFQSLKPKNSGLELALTNAVMGLFTDWRSRASTFGCDILVADVHFVDELELFNGFLFLPMLSSTQPRL